MNFSRRILWVCVFAVAFAFVESSVVVYLRALYYPGGFSLPLRPVSPQHMVVELAREFSTLVMLGAVGMIAGTTRWSRFAYFAIAFGVWDLFYYVWLKVVLDWPASLFDWDILFLLPLPWIGPVLAPVLISLLLVTSGLIILHHESGGNSFVPGATAWQFASAGTLVILISFMWDIDASIRMLAPKPYPYELLVIGVACYLAGMWKSAAGRQR
jgi:hypothetical protein